MTVASVQFESQSFGRWATYQVILPDKGEGPFPVILQLHGLGTTIGRGSTARTSFALPRSIRSSLCFRMGARRGI